MGLSIRAYARHRGVSHVAVKKAIDTELAGELAFLASDCVDHRPVGARRRDQRPHRR